MNWQSLAVRELIFILHDLLRGEITSIDELSEQLNAVRETLIIHSDD